MVLQFKCLSCQKLFSKDKFIRIAFRTSGKSGVTLKCIYCVNNIQIARTKKYSSAS